MFKIKFKVGDIVIFNEYKDNMTRGKSYIVTRGKSYIVTRVSPDETCVWVDDDNGQDVIWSNLRFMTIKQCRKHKLQRCLIEKSIE